ncbi:protein of unknown function [Methylocella tundrae]|uniref:Uncharacterized protein n=1 Tax=Methylocella tundrae TaxID=227605 RepID=A0A4U8YYE1_METTU|nr:protein of unknown function [Methylocella tundrae]
MLILPLGILAMAPAKATRRSSRDAGPPLPPPLPPPRPAELARLPSAFRSRLRRSPARR